MNNLQKAQAAIDVLIADKSITGMYVSEVYLKNVAIVLGEAADDMKNESGQ